MNKETVPVVVGVALMLVLWYLTTHAFQQQQQQQCTQQQQHLSSGIDASPNEELLRIDSATADLIDHSNPCSGILESKQHEVDANGRTPVPCKVSMNKELHDILEATSLTRMQARNAWVDPGPADANQAKAFPTMPLSRSVTVSLLAPYYPCLFTFDRPLVSKLWDGYKALCGVLETSMRDLAAGHKPCLVYSFGSNENDHFERTVLAQNPACEIHVFDPTSPPLPQYHFHQYGLGAVDGGEFLLSKAVPERGHLANSLFKSKSVPQIMRELGHSQLDILKFDIDGQEWPVLRALDYSKLKIGLLLFEIHDFDDLLGITSLQVLEIFQRIEGAGFRHYSIEPVCATCFTQYELAFIHRDWNPYTGIWPDN